MFYFIHNNSFTKFGRKTVFLSVFFTSQMLFAQNTPFERVEKSNYVRVSGKFHYQNDDGKYSKWKDDVFLYADSVVHDKDSLLSSVHLTNGNKLNFWIYMEPDKSNSYGYLSRRATFSVCDTCKIDGRYVKYICNDSTAFFSTHPAKPFRYGEVVDKNKINTYRKQAEFFDFQPGDSVVSIGAASGWYEGAISVFTDSVDYLIQEIDPFLLDEKELNGVVNYFSSLRETPQTNTFHLIIGKTDDAGLPDGKKYDKILLNNCYHHFDKKWMMMHDLVSHLKDDGELILAGESFSNFYLTEYHGGCEIRALQAKDVIRFYATHGLYPVRMVMPLNAIDNVIVFSKNEMESAKRIEQLEPVNKVVFKIDRLHTSHYAGDTVYLNSLETELLEFLPTLHATYDSLDFYLIDIAYFWMDRYIYENAINVLNLADKLYPDNGDIQLAIGEAYLWNDNEEMALSYFVQAEKLDPELKEDIKELLKFWREWMGLPEVKEEILEESID